jgi:fatty acid synthase subunit alpha, fungi type
LVVNVSYQSANLVGATEKLCKEDLEGEELCTAKELATVYNTEDGMNKLF